eukprot:CAMPEP_0183736282 /NCGR_PEP_ID=MMETSP0737-20130205/48962_1 /TAXON_ID=385413 /ORGANISM="Thalassiosira miniscula, Strain CCMP1093" /LENGTH=289 /DNA_ID=CAMNT_0025970237 /DNA_START=171 /DNA_END=1037 /DNA_ORIENTATION=-
MNDDDSDWSDTTSIDSCEEFISFESIRNPSTQLEEAISFSWPGIYEDEDEDDKGKEAKKLRKIVLTTLLEEEDLAPLFDGSRWAGTRVWAAAIIAIQFISGHLDGTESILLENRIKLPKGEDRVAMLELGCGLGVPGIIFHMLGGDVVLTDQADILTQIETNIASNFSNTAIASSQNKDAASVESERNNQNHTIQAMPLSWSRTDINGLLKQLGRSDIGFDLVINCDCVYEPLYGKSWHLLNETIDELLSVNPKCVVLSSMERRQADGIDKFLEEMRNMEHVGSVERVW